MKVSIELPDRGAQRGNLLAEACPSRDVLKHMTSRWGVLVLRVLAGGTHRFSALRRAIGGVSERMLAQTLQWLENDGLVDRTAFDVVPPHVEYSLTPLGREAAGKVGALADWIEINLPQILAGREPAAAAGSGRHQVDAGMKRQAISPPRA
ncbi:winged helix-turn-helix transcriptional regulator [Castellaniella sp.]|uniref:winged helix-turn-helix transcriptional regulator n=1 Tax=Castellaniella sp. TaxID=1955812 RepID=UPI003C70C0D2